VKKANSGFTLVELMIVVAIIGILAAVAIPKFAQMLEKSREGATKGNLAAITSAASNYYADQQGQYPNTLDTQTWTLAGVSYPAFIPQYIDQISPVKVTAANTNNAAAAQNFGPGIGNSNNFVTTATWSGAASGTVPAGPPFSSTSTGYGWRYDKNVGAVWVNSRLVDMSDNSYTTFGFQ